MPVLSVSVPRANEARLGLSCLKHGVEATRIDEHGGVVYADLTGTDEKTLRAAVEAGATAIATITYTEKPGAKQGEYGLHGTGVPLDDTINRMAVYGSLMQAAR